MFKRKIHKLLILLFIAGCATNNETLVRPGPSITVENPSEETVEVYSNGWYIGTVDAHGKYTFINLPAKKDEIVAIGKKTHARYWTEVDLKNNNHVVWKIQVPEKKSKEANKLKIRVDNDADVPIKVWIDDVKKGSVGPKEHRDFIIIEKGEHLVRLQKDKEIRSFKIFVEQGVTPVVKWRGTPAPIVIKNPYRIKIYVNVDNKKEAVIDPVGSKSVYVSGGKHVIHFRMPESAKCKEVRMDIKEGRVYQIEPECELSSLIVINRTNEDLRIFRDSTELGTAPGGGVVEFDGLVPAKAVLKAEDRDGMLVARTTKRLIPDEKVLWTVTKGQGIYGPTNFGSIVVVNKTKVPVDVWIDDVLRGRVMPGRNLLLPYLFKGKHRIYVLGPQERVFGGGDFVIKENEQRVWKVFPMYGTIHVVNKWGGAVKVLIDGKDEFRLDKDADRVITLPAGSHIIDVSDSEMADHRVIQVRGEVNQEVDLMPPYGKIKVINLTKRPLNITIDDRNIGLLEGLQSVKLDKIRVGRHVLRAVDRSSDALWVIPVNVKRGKVVDVKVGSD